MAHNNTLSVLLLAPASVGEHHCLVCLKTGSHMVASQEYLYLQKQILNIISRAVKLCSLTIWRVVLK